MNVVPADPPGRAGQGELMDRAGRNRPPRRQHGHRRQHAATDGSTATALESPADDARPGTTARDRPAARRTIVPAGPGTTAPTAGTAPAGGTASAGAGGGRRRALAAGRGHPAPGRCWPATWPPGSPRPGRGRCYLPRGQLPETTDVASYVWDLWWVAASALPPGQPVVHHAHGRAGRASSSASIPPCRSSGSSCRRSRAVFGPAASFNLLTIVMPGLLCYVMYRAARLWLRSQAGAIAAGAFFGLSSMLAEQDWAHLNIVAGTLFLPMTVEAAVRLRRSPGRRQAIILGLVLGASLLVNQESAVLAAILAALLLIPWLVRHPARDRAAALILGGVVAVVVASPQLIAMIQQARARRHRSRPAPARGHQQEIRRVDHRPVRAGPASWLLRAAAAGGGLRVGPGSRAHREGMPMFGLVLDHHGADRPGRLLAAAQRLAARRLVAGQRLARARRDAVCLQGPARAVPADLERRPGLAGDALHLGDAAAGAVRVPGGGPVRHSRPGRRRPAGRRCRRLAPLPRPAADHRRGRPRAYWKRAPRPARRAPG